MKPLSPSDYENIELIKYFPHTSRDTWHSGQILKDCRASWRIMHMIVLVEVSHYIFSMRKVGIMMATLLAICWNIAANT